MAGLQRIHHEEGMTAATLGPAFIWAFRGEPRADWMALCGSTMHAMAPRHAAGVVCITIVAPGVPPRMDAEARRVAGDVTRSLNPLLKGSLNVLEGTGFWAAAARGILSSISFVGGLRCPTATLATLEEGAAWSEKHLGGLGMAPRGDLLAALHAVRHGTA